jgi:hypothetical protein
MIESGMIHTLKRMICRFVAVKRNTFKSQCNTPTLLEHQSWLHKFSVVLEDTQ